MIDKKTSEAIMNEEIEDAHHSLIQNFREAEKYLKNTDITPCDSLFEDRNLQKAKEAFGRCEAILNRADFKVEKLSLKNVRRLQDLELNFNDRLTVLIGENSTGKTTVCESLTKVLSWVLVAIKREKNEGITLTDDDIKTGTKRAEVGIDLKLDSHNFIHFSLAHSFQDRGIEEPSNLLQLQEYAKIIRECITVNGCAVTLPLFIFYGVNRSNFVRGARKIYLNRMKAYDDALDDQVRISDMIEWFITLENLSKQENGTELRDLEQFKALLEKTLAEFLHEYAGADELKQALLEDALQGLRTKLKDAEEQIIVLQSKPFSTAQKLKQLVDETVRDLIPNATGIFVDRSTGKDRVVLNIYGEYHDIQHLSHGQRSILFMVIDLLSRLDILNPHLEDPRTSPGVVIIDEIELHLHPNWQQTIIDSLLKIFPNMQFIITTHSPQVISTVHKNQIRFLKSDPKTHQIKVHEPSFQTRGLSADNILLRILNIAEVPDILEQRQYQELEKLIENELDDSEEGQMLYQILEKHFGSNSIEMEKIYHLKKLQGMKSRLRQRRKDRGKDQE
ncbi:retron Ec78 anti-phage system effector ATPase PtuA [Ignatzschineria sp. LJL83]